MKKLDYKELEEHIVRWLKDYVKRARVKGFVIGVSGGLDSAVVSTLAAKTGLPLLVLEMPIKQKSNEVDRAQKHINWLEENFKNVESREIDSEFYLPNEEMDEPWPTINIFEAFMEKIKSGLMLDLSLTEAVEGTDKINLAEANARSRMRMIILYYAASLNNYLVLGTGNKVEDFGVGFYTKYGDGGVDISPIADLMKSEVRELGKSMGIIEEIITAAPTDGLWNDGRTDEDQLGATYDELEWAMNYLESCDYDGPINTEAFILPNISKLTPRQIQVVEIYIKKHSANKHKMDPIPVFNTQFLR